MIKRFDDFEKDDCCPECGLPMSECGCEPNEEQKCDCGKPECNCGTEEIKETKSFNDFFVNENVENVEIRYSDYLGEKYGQEYTISHFGDLDENTEITSAFKAGMKKQVELIQKLIDGVKYNDL